MKRYNEDKIDNVLKCLANCEDFVLSRHKGTIHISAFMVVAVNPHFRKRRSFQNDAVLLTELISASLCLPPSVADKALYRE